jgi:NADH dehydrogenase
MSDQTASGASPTRHPTVLVIGGTGFVGRALCRLLSARGDWRIVVTTRDPKHGDALSGLPNVFIERLDPLSEDGLRAALQSIDAVVNLVAILHGTSQQFHTAHIKLPDLLGREVRKLGGRRLVHVSAIGVDEARDSMYLQSKSWGERLVLEAWSETTVLRPSVIFGKEDRFINTFARLQRFVPFVPLACSDARFQPVWVDDVALAIATALDRPETSARTFECAGPDLLTLREIVRRAGRWAGVGRPILPLPLPVARAQAWIMEQLPGEPLMSRDNLRSMQTPNVAAPGALSLRDLGIIARPLDDYLARG